MNVENRGSTGCYFRADTIGERHGLGLGCFLSPILSRSYAHPTPFPYARRAGGAGRKGEDGIRGKVNRLGGLRFKVRPDRGSRGRIL